MATPWKHPKTGVYYIRRSVPVDLRSKLGHEYKRSLKTKDTKEAKRLFPAASAEFERLVEASRSGLRLSPLEAKMLAGQWLQDALKAEHDARQRTNWVSRYDEGNGHPDSAVSDSDLVLEEMEALREEMNHSEAASPEPLRAYITPLTCEVLRRATLPVETNGESFNHLADELFSAKMRLHATLRQWDRDNWNDQGALDGYPTNLAEASKVFLRPAISSNETKGPTLRDAFEKWKQVRKPTVKSVGEYERAVRRFEEMFGGVPVDGITRRMATEFTDALMEMPALVPSALKDRPMPEVLKRAPDGERLSVGSINKHVNALRTIVALHNRRAGERDESPRFNPFEGMSIAKRSSDLHKRRQGYSLEDLQTIFSSPIFTESYRPRAGGGEAAKWLPLLGVYTGARLAEIAGLRVQDVKRIEYAWYISIVPHEKRRIKNESSIRDVALHPEVVRLGFPEYVEQMRGRGEEFLFPELEANSADQFGASWSKWWGRYCRSIGITDKTKVFHSFRHTFKTAARTVGIPEDVHDAITGHSNGMTGRHYGRHPLLVQADELRKIDYSIMSFMAR